MKLSFHITKTILFCAFYINFIIYRQIFKLISVKETVNKISIKDLYFKVLQHELPEVDLTQGRGTLDKNTVFMSVSY